MSSYGEVTRSLPEFDPLKTNASHLCETGPEVPALDPIQRLVNEATITDTPEPCTNLANDHSSLSVTETIVDSNLSSVLDDACDPMPSIVESNPSLNEEAMNISAVEVDSNVEAQPSRDDSLTEIISSNCPFAPGCPGCYYTLLQLSELSDKEILEMFIDHGVLNDVAHCKRCGKITPLNKKNWLFRCYNSVSLNKQRKKKCAWRMSAQSKTFIHDSHLTHQQDLCIIAMLLTLNAPRSKAIIEFVDVTADTVITKRSRYHEILIDHFFHISQKVGGFGHSVEVYLVPFKSCKQMYGQTVEGQWVYAGYDSDTKQSFMVPVESHDSQTLLNILAEWIEPGSVIYSDCWRSYKCLKEEGYRNLAANLSLTFIKRKIKSRNVDGVSKPQTKGDLKPKSVSHLAEHLFKHKYALKDRLHTFLVAAAELFPPQP